MRNLRKRQRRKRRKKRRIRKRRKSERRVLILIRAAKIQVRSQIKVSNNLKILTKNQVEKGEIHKIVNDENSLLLIFIQNKTLKNLK